MYEIIHLNRNFMSMLTNVGDGCCVLDTGLLQLTSSDDPQQNGVATTDSADTNTALKTTTVNFSSV
jgi:hypothetical protein